MEKGPYSVSVIVPIYKVERFIARCVTSLMVQTLRDVEFIFVDDASPDASVRRLQEVTDRYPARKEHVRLIRHETNLGLPAARNSGLAVAQGQYVFHCDSDDYVDPGMLEELCGEALRSDADIVWCDWWLSFEKSERYMKQPGFATPFEALRGMLDGVMKFNVWNKLVRRSLYAEQHVCFPAGYGMGEDMTMIRLMARARRIAYLPKAFYHYVQLNSGAFSKTYSDRHLVELQHNVALIEQDLRSLYGNRLEEDLAFFKLDVKFPFLISADSRRYALWRAWYPEANRFILRNRRISRRSRMLQWLASKGQFWAIRLYYVCVHRLIYGLIYR